jgi:SNF2 family DNA or RNA helicase
VYGTVHQATGNHKAARRVLSPEQLDAFCSCFNFVVFDELHLLGDHTTLTFALAKHLSVKADYVYGLTGTPFGRDPQRMWSLFNVVDLGETLGKTLGIYRASFFREKPDFWAGVVYEFDHKYKMLLHRVLQHRSIRYLEHEVGDVPKVQKQVLEFPLTEEQQEHYNRIRGLITESGGDAETRKNTYIRSRQLTAGFMTLTGEDDRKIQIQFKVSAKVVALAALIEQLPEGAKLVIFHQYIYSGVLIQELLQKHKIKFCGVGHGFKDSELQLQRFVSHPDYRAFVANVGAGGTGVDGLQKVCHYGVFFESPSDPKLRAQCEKRLARSGQRHKVFLYDLAAQGTVDAKILRYLEEGRDLFEAVCNGKVKSL